MQQSTAIVVPIAAEKMCGKGRDILMTLTQRWQAEGNNIETVIDFIGNRLYSAHADL